MAGMSSEDREAIEARIEGRLELGELSEAATEALRGYGAEILGYVVSILRDESAASDVFADFCEDLWKGIPGFRRQCSFRTWAYKLAWNAARMHWRDPFRRRVRRLATEEYKQVAECLLVSSLRRDPLVADRVTRMRESLRPDDQTLLILRVDRGLSWKEIAEVLAETEVAPPDPAALRKRYERLKQCVAQWAQREGLIAGRRR